MPGGSIIAFSRNTASVLFFYLSDLNCAEKKKREISASVKGAALLGVCRGFVLVSSADKSMDVWCLLSVESAHTQRLSGLLTVEHFTADGRSSRGLMETLTSMAQAGVTGCSLVTENTH